MSIVQFLCSFFIALRPLSLSLAFTSIAFGLLAAAADGDFIPRDPQDWLLAGLILVAGIASQAGANLINDYFEGSFKYHDPSRKSLQFLGRKRSHFDVFVFLAGIGTLGGAGLIGLYLIYVSDLWMLLIGLIGLIGAYAYTGEPFVYKRRGMGAPLSFVLMGILMPLGAWYPYGGGFSPLPVLFAMPVSLLIPALMLSNEVRDFRRDHRLSMGTLSVRIGMRWTLRLFGFLLIGSFLLIPLYVLLGIYPPLSLLALLLIPLGIRSYGMVKRGDRLGIPVTNHLHVSMTVLLLAALLVDGFFFSPP